jgi:hypothetical protein
MKAFLSNFFDGIKSLLGILSGFVAVGLSIMVVMFPFIIIDYFFGEDEPSQYDPADLNQDGIVTAEEDEYYYSDTSEQYNGK